MNPHRRGPHGRRAPRVLCRQTRPAANGAQTEAALAIEKAFAINATPERIYAALERELAEASTEADGAFEVLRREPGRSLELRVTIGDVPCWLTYQIAAKDGYTEVSGRLTPFGLRYLLFRTITLGLRDQGFALALVQGLVNLKEALEAEDDT